MAGGPRRRAAFGDGGPSKSNFVLLLLVNFCSTMRDGTVIARTKGRSRNREKTPVGRGGTESG